jgi:transcriptional regulator with XRE-family HTH domain
MVFRGRFMTEIGNTIRRARRAMGWTQRELAQRAGMGQSHVLRVEQGGDVRLSTVQRLAEALGAEFVMLPRQTSNMAQHMGDLAWRRMGRPEMMDEDGSEEEMLFTIENTAEDQ